MACALFCILNRDFLAVYLKLTNLLGVAESLNSKVNGMKNECDRVS